MSFGTIISDVILGWKFNKQTSYWSKTGFFLSVKNHDKFSSQNIIRSSQNNVGNYRTEGHEQVFSILTSKTPNIDWWTIVPISIEKFRRCVLGTATVSVHELTSLPFCWKAKINYLKGEPTFQFRNYESWIFTNCLTKHIFLTRRLYNSRKNSDTLQETGVDK